VSLTADVSHIFSLGSGTLTPEIGTKFQSGQYYDFYNVPDSYQPAYTRSYVDLTYAPNIGRWTVMLYVRNLENSVVMSDESESFAPPITQPGTYNVDFQAPRTFGVTITDHF
jgi:iron complex outermembrane receptor protein